MNHCAHDTPRLSPAAVDELAGLLHPDTSAAMLTTLRRLADTTSPGPVADAWEILAVAVDEANEIAVVNDLHRGRTP